jgi:hypothetical protein
VVNTPTVAISVMGSLLTTESQDTHLTSHPKDGTLLPLVIGICFRQEERVPPTDPPTPLPEASVLPSRDLPGPTLLSLASEANQQWDDEWYAGQAGFIINMNWVL